MQIKEETFGSGTSIRTILKLYGFFFHPYKMALEMTVKKLRFSWKIYAKHRREFLQQKPKQNIEIDVKVEY